MIVAAIIVVPADNVFIKADAANSVTGGTLNSATFIIDPGHGGSDPGACLGSRTEASDVLNLSIRVAQLIIASGESCALTRTSDVTQELATKTSIANAGSFSYFVSIHRNAGGGVGIESYYHSNLSSSSTAAQLCTKIHNSMVNAGVWTKNRGVKTANYYVLRCTNMPATLLEVGFIDSTVDNAIFDASFETIAVSIANGMLSMVGKSVSSSKYQSNLDNPSGGGKTNAAITATASVTQTGTSSDSLPVAGWTLHTDGISSVRYQIDGGSWTNLSVSTRSDVQAAISGYSDYSNCGFSGNISYRSLANGNHTVTIQAVTKKSATYTVATITLKVTDPIAPTLSSVTVSNVSKDGYRVSCTVSDNAGVTSVQFPTWTESGGQDDLVWHTGTISGNTAYCDISVSDHNSEHGVYITHIYAYDAAGNSGGGQCSVDLTEDTVAPEITEYSITNVDYFGFDVSCKATDNVGVSKILFPTWTDADWQDDIVWYEPTVTNGVATLHVNTSNHNYETGLYNVHLYAWDLWNNSKCVTLTVDVPAPVYPTDTDYIPVTTINASAYESSSQIWTTGTFASTYWGVLVLAPTDGGYVVTEKYNSGTAKSVTASVNNPILAVHSGIEAAYAAFELVEVGQVITLEGIIVADGVVLSGSYAKLPYSFKLTDASAYSLNELYVRTDGVNKTASEVAQQFKCVVSVFDALGALLEDSVACGTGCVVKYISAAGEVLNSATVVVAGDVDGDGLVTTSDLIGVRGSLKSKTELSGAYLEACDVDGDGAATTADYSILKTEMAG